MLFCIFDSRDTHWGMHGLGPVYESMYNHMLRRQYQCRTCAVCNRFSEQKFSRHPWLKSIRLRYYSLSSLTRPCPFWVFPFTCFLFFRFFLRFSFAFVFFSFFRFHFWHFNCCPVQRARSNATIYCTHAHRFRIYPTNHRPTDQPTNHWVQNERAWVREWREIRLDPSLLQSFIMHQLSKINHRKAEIRWNATRMSIPFGRLCKYTVLAKPSKACQPTILAAFGSLQQKECQPQRLSFSICLSLSHSLSPQHSALVTHALCIRDFCKMHKRFVSLIDFGFQCNICAGAKWMFLTVESNEKKIGTRERLATVLIAQSKMEKGTIHCTIFQRSSIIVLSEFFYIGPLSLCELRSMRIHTHTKCISK